MTANKANLHFLQLSSIQSMVLFFIPVLHYTQIHTLYGGLPGLPPLPARRARTVRPLRDPADGSRTEVGSEVFEPEPVTSVVKMINIFH